MQRAGFLSSVVLGLGLAGGAIAEETSDGTGAVLRALDKISGEVAEMTVGNEKSIKFKRLTVSVDQCRYPRANPSGNAFAFVTILQNGNTDPIFRGWMIASSPALNAVDHPRFDVWLLRCTTS